MSSKHDPALVTAALAGLEAATREAIALAPEAHKDLQRMAGTHMAIEFTEPQLEIFVSIDTNGALRFASYSEEQGETRVRGPLRSFAALASAEDPAASLINSDIEVIGPTAPLLELQEILSTIDIDWEAPLVARLGDVVGHQLAESLRGFSRWARHAADSLRRQVSEFVLEEGRLSPPALELDDFYRQVHSLTLQVDRLESRARRLRERIDALRP